MTNTMDIEKPDLLDQILHQMETTEESMIKCVANLKSINESSNDVLMNVESENSQILNNNKMDRIYSFNTRTYETMTEIIELLYANEVSLASCNSTSTATAPGNFTALNNFCNIQEARLNSTFSNFRKLKIFSEKLAEITYLRKLNDDEDNDLTLEDDVTE